MKLSLVARTISALLATDAKPTEASILAACIAADKKGKDEGGLGPVEIENKAKDAKAADEKDMEENAAKDAAAEWFGKTKDEWEKMPAKDRKAARDAATDPEKTNDGDPDLDAEDDVQPKETVTGGGAPGGNKGKEPAKDTAAIVRAALAADRALTAARTAVEPVLGVVTYDSAAEVYGAALAKLGVDTKGVDPSAFGAMYALARKAADATTPVIASDAATLKTMAGAIKGYDRLPAR